MGKPFTSPRSFWLTILAFTIIVNLTLTRLTYLHLVEIKADLFRSTWGGMLVVFMGIAVACAWLMVRIARNRSQVIERIEKIALDTLPWRILGAVTFIEIAYQRSSRTRPIVCSPAARAFGSLEPQHDRGSRRSCLSACCLS